MGVSLACLRTSTLSFALTFVLCPPTFAQLDSTAQDRPVVPPEPIQVWVRVGIRRAVPRRAVRPWPTSIRLST